MKLMARILLFVPEITQPMPVTHWAVSRIPETNEYMLAENKNFGKAYHVKGETNAQG